MTQETEAYFPPDYRAARTAFIQACERAHVDSIARVHPTACAPDGRPLFIDSAALGPRDAAKGLLVVAGADSSGTDALTALLAVTLPQHARLVLVHGVSGPDSWSLAMLGDILTEDMARVERLRVLALARGPAGKVAAMEQGPLADAIRAAKPKADIRIARLTLDNGDAQDQLRAAVRAALAAF